MSLKRRVLPRRERAPEMARAAAGNGTWMERNRTLLEFLRNWLEAFGVLTAAVIGVSQYLANSRAEQVNMTLKYLDRYQTERLLDARKTLEEQWNSRSREVFDILGGPDGEARLAAYLQETIARSQLGRPIGVIMDFYDELEACTTADLCDRDTAVRFFGKYAWDFRGLLAPYIQRQREEMHDALIGSGVDYFSLQYQQSAARATGTGR